MKVLNLEGEQRRRTYEVGMVCSPLWECALGIAAVTYPRIHPTLEKPESYWQELRKTLSKPLNEELDFVERHNTWKTLLQLLHEKFFASLEDFLTYIQTIDGVSLRSASLPYLGDSLQNERRKAASGDKGAVKILVQASLGHSFYPDYIPFICEVSIEKLRVHLIKVMKGWFEQQIAPSQQRITEVLERDWQAKLEMKEKLEPEAFVEWATGGVVYPPEPGVWKVLLVPQMIYRPWNITAELEGTKIYYYPVADESLEVEQDPYRPGLAMVQRYKALGDEVRLRIVKLLFEKKRSLQELTAQLDLAKSTVHHHLALLRSSGLVVTEKSHYVLRESLLFAVDAELRDFLK
ncbi:MAG TPA: metalloregulator ArsR/SmtB family transcription factor [Bacillales bacterium]|nr:metalloregulator ArsR/SmtB family transcription factor [Bacillales bacterium]